MMTVHKSEKFHTLRYSQHLSHSGRWLVKKQGIYFVKNLSERLKTVAEAEFAFLVLKDVQNLATLYFHHLRPFVQNFKANREFRIFL
jgi:hypothetical protein